MTSQTQQPKILILGTLSGGYAGAELDWAKSSRLPSQHLHPARDVPGHFPARILPAIL